MINCEYILNKMYVKSVSIEQCGKKKNLERLTKENDVNKGNMRDVIIKSEPM